MKNLMTRLFREEEGQGMVEYGIIIAAIAVVVMVAVFALGTRIKAGFDDILRELQTPTKDYKPPAAG